MTELRDRLFPESIQRPVIHCVLTLWFVFLLCFFLRRSEEELVVLLLESKVTDFMGTAEISPLNLVTQVHSADMNKTE